MLNHAFGVIQWLAADTVGTTYTVNLPAGFNLKAIKFYSVGIQSATDALSETTHGRTTVGFATGTAARRAVGATDYDNATENTSGAAIRNDCVALTADDTGAITGLLDVTTFSSEQFILTVADQVPNSLTVGYDAWGGSDITVATVGDFAEPAATGVQSYTVTGFTAAGTDQVVMLGGCNVTAALNSPGDVGSAVYAGYFTGSASAENIVVSGRGDDGSANTQVSSYCKTGECLTHLTKIGGAPGARAIGNFATDAFQLNWLERTTTGRKSIYLALKGGQWKAGAYTIDGTTINATATVSGLPFQPIGLNLIGAMRVESTVDVSTIKKVVAFGSGSSTTSRQSMGLDIVNNAVTSDVNTTIQYDQVLCYPSDSNTLQAAYDIDAITSDGFRIITDVGPGVASEWQGYLAFAGAPSKAFPFRRPSFTHMLVR